MSGSENCGVLQQDLELLERTVVEELQAWLMANGDAEWKYPPRSSLVQQYSETGPRQILQKLAQVCLYLLSLARVKANNCRVLASLRFGHHIRDGKSRRENSFQFLQLKVVRLEMRIELIP
jgi:hypothetical protein